MKTIGPHTTPHAGIFQIAYEEIPHVEDQNMRVFLYYVTAPNGHAFRIALTALKAFISDSITAQALMESDGLKRLTALLDTTNKDGFMVQSPSDPFGGFMLDIVGPDTSDEPAA